MVIDTTPSEQIIAACEIILSAQEMSPVGTGFYWIGMVFLVLFGIAYIINLIKDVYP